MVKKTKAQTLTEKSTDYISEKEILVNGKSMWCIKKNATIKIMDGEKVVYDGSSRAFHKWLRIQKQKN